MPIVTTFASLSKNGFSSVSSDTNNQTNWLSVFDVKANGALGTVGQVKTIKDTPYIYGNGAIIPTSRPFYTDLNITSGLAGSYKIFADVNNASAQSDLNDVVVDGSNNTHVLFASASSTDVSIAKYDSSGSFVLGKTITGSFGSIGNSVKMAIDTSNNIYILSMTGASGVFITKIDAASYTVSWSKFYDFGGTYSFNSAGGNAGELLFDSLNNLYLILGTSSSGGANFVVKIASSGTVTWSKVTTYTTDTIVNKSCLDTNDNFYMLLNKSVPSIINILVKLDSSGNTLYEYTLSTTSEFYVFMEINSVGNLMLVNSTNTTLNPTNMLSIGNINSTPAVAYATSFTTASDRMGVNSLACGAQGTYLGLNFVNNVSVPPSKNTMGVLKLPPNCNLTGTDSWNFTITTDDLTNYLYNGSITFAAGTSSTLSSSTLITLTTPGITITSISTSTSNTTPGSNATVPFTYNAYIV